MKKNISINVSGIIFHIEEDGYEPLKNYLDSINRYFSTFDDSHEIIADIEGRIAEIFLNNLKDGKQVIAHEDVKSLIGTMGSIKDFQEAEEGGLFSTGTETAEDEKEETVRDPSTTRRLYRDTKRKLLGGVLSGISYYFNIDALWTRLIFILLFFGVSVLPSIAGFLFIGYILLWIIVPGNDALKEERKVKKMYRNPEGKVLGGVAGGVAAYFGTDVVLIRLLFVALIFAGGTGVILYIILWIILPEAKSITDKMEMKGQPVTLSNIESTIKKSLSVSEGEENVFVKILLFPFRLIATLFDFLSKLMGPFLHFFVDALRIITGILLILIGILSIAALIVGGGVLLGIIAGGEIDMIYNIPLDVLKQDLKFLPGISLIIGLIIPFMGLAILGFSVITRKYLINSRIAWSMFALWLIAIAVFSASVPSVVRQFSTYGQHVEKNEYDIAGKTVVLRSASQPDAVFSDITMNIRSHDDALVVVELSYQAVGTDRSEASDNARMLEYRYSQSDSTFIFQTGASFARGAHFRSQELTINFFIPNGQKFVMEPGMRKLIGNFMHRRGFKNEFLNEEYIWVFENNELRCLNCPTEKGSSDGQSEGIDLREIRGYFKNYEMTGFYGLNIGSDFDVKVRKGNEYEVIVNGRQSEVANVEVIKQGDQLRISHKSKRGSDKDESKIKIYITMPEISSITFTDDARANIAGFSSGLLEVEAKDASLVELDHEGGEIVAKIEDKSRLVLSGKGTKLNATVSDGAKLFAFDFTADQVELNTSHAASARITAEKNMQINSKGASNVRYRGDARVIIDKSDGSSVVKD
ncbi:MAG: PspC domain-containing protein [Cyclobacteriaceae bacterium]|nr:PspC domain-containing protein [Cyclobacteriaceae bacterium]